MNKKFAFILASLLMLTSGVSLVGCDIFGDSSEKDDSSFPQIDNTVDLDEFSPLPDDDTEYLEGETYYTSAAIDLVTEINGNYSVDRPFTLDKEDENKRIYHNVYFYAEDFFQVIYYKDITKLGEIYAVLSDETDTQYAEIEYSTDGSPLQINIKQQGIYNLVLDVQTFGVDMVKVGDIQTPVYETVKSCELKVQTSASNVTYSAMTLDKDTNEYCIQAEIPANASIGFYSESHMSCYKTTVEAGLGDRYVYWNFSNPASITVHVGGTYKVYFHAKTYVVRLELQNPDTASYYCQVEWLQGNVLTVTSGAPYLFEYEFVAQGTASDPYVELPDFYPERGMSYDLSVIDENGFVFADMYVTESGRYKLTVNLKEFTLSVKKI